MAQGYVQIRNLSAQARVSEVKIAYANFRRAFDALIALYATNGGTNASAVQALLQASQPNVAGVAADGQTAYDNLDAAMAGLTTAYNALSNIDTGVL